MYKQLYMLLQIQTSSLIDIKHVTVRGITQRHDFALISFENAFNGTKSIGFMLIGINPNQ